MPSAPSATGLLLAAGVTGAETEATTVTLETTQKNSTSSDVKFEMNVTKNGTDISGNLQFPVTVTLNLPTSFQQYLNSSYTCSVKHNEKDLPNSDYSFDSKNNTVTFTTNSFSPFEVVATRKTPSTPSTPTTPTTPVTPVTPDHPTFVSDTNSALSVNNAYTFKITSKDGKAPQFAVGTPGTFTWQLVKQNGNDYYYKITAVGPVGKEAGIYVNGTKLLVATVKSSSLYLLSDTDYAFAMQQGKTYTYRFEVAGPRGTGIAIYPTDTSVLKPAGLKKTVEKGHDVYYYTVKAVGAAGTKAAVYTRLPGQTNVNHGTAVVKATPVTLLCDTDYAFTMQQGKTYTYRFEVAGPRGTGIAIYPTNTSVLKPAGLKKTVEKGHDVYYYTVKAVGAAGTKAAVYTRLPGEQNVSHGTAAIQKAAK